MRLSTRQLLDRSFTAVGLFSIALMAGALVVLLAPIVGRGAGAFVFRATVEHRRFLLDRFERGDAPAIQAQTEQVAQARRPVYDLLRQFEKDLEGSRELRRQYGKPLGELKQAVAKLLGPAPGDPRPVLPRDQYGQTRWERAQVKAHELLYVKGYDYSDPTRMGVKTESPRANAFAGTSLAPLFPYVESHLEAMLLPRWTFYWGFLFDEPVDSNMLGGIWPAFLGTLYLTFLAMLVAGPMGLAAGIYFAEYAGAGRLVSILRTCIGTLAGVPSIVFGLFGLSFFIKTVHISESKSVLAGSLTLALLVLPTVIRASEEAIRAVSHAYREAALALGAGKWRTVATVVLPAALSGILTGVIISMGRAAGETAPIIFTAAVSLGKALRPWEIFTQPTPALSWNIYNLCTEHEAVEEIRHAQYGMVLTLIALALGLNLAAVVLRARIARRLRG
ncbi:MAG: phosphate ABC transporter permease PstA [Candidatus Sumerlaeota bacterium]|nr:phosphate ABC transporter permease PstA [Candidatus Sumerlaeota bacterium]